MTGAIADYTKAIDLDPSSATAFANRGVSYLQTGREDLADRDFTRSFQLDPSLKPSFESYLKKMKNRKTP